MQFEAELNVPYVIKQIQLIMQVSMIRIQRHVGIKAMMDCGATRKEALSIISVAPFTELADCLDQPAAEHVWRAIQERVRANSEAYETVFDFIAQSRSQVQVMSEAAEKRYPDGFPASIWPTWTYRDALDLDLGGYLKEPAPHQEKFWLKGDPDAPMGVTGFICALPVKWTKGEESNSGFNLTILANRQSEQGAGNVVAQSESPSHKDHHS